jgi:hypothetical protein
MKKEFAITVTPIIPTPCLFGILEKRGCKSYKKWLRKSKRAGSERL